MAKIIQFPKEKMKTPPQSKKELDAELLNNKVAYVDDVANHYSSSVFNKLAMHGFNVLASFSSACSARKLGDALFSIGLSAHYNC